MEIKKLSFNQERLLHFNWPITRYCNYSCTYCCTNNMLNQSHAHTPAWPHVIDKLKKSNKFNLCLSGGEPTYHPDFYSILDALTECNIGTIFLFTNFSKPVETYTKINNKNVVLHISYHPEYDKKFKREKLLEIKKLGIPYSLTVMMHHYKYWDEIQGIIDFSEENNIDFQLSLLYEHGPFKPIYTDKFWKKFGKYFKESSVYDSLDILYDDGSESKIDTDDLIYNPINNFKGYKCQAKMFNIQFDGKITNACTDIETIIPGAICPKDRCDGILKLAYTKERI